MMPVNQFMTRSPVTKHIGAGHGGSQRRFATGARLRRFPRCARPDVDRRD
jgi:hypothetical protein